MIEKIKNVIEKNKKHIIIGSTAIAAVLLVGFGVSSKIIGTRNVEADKQSSSSEIQTELKETEIQIESCEKKDDPQEICVTAEEKSEIVEPETPKDPPQEVYVEEISAKPVPVSASSSSEKSSQEKKEDVKQQPKATQSEKKSEESKTKASQETQKKNENKPTESNSQTNKSYSEDGVLVIDSGEEDAYIPGFGVVHSSGKTYQRRIGKEGDKLSGVLVGEMG